MTPTNFLLFLVGIIGSGGLTAAYLASRAFDQRYGKPPYTKNETSTPAQS